MVAALFRFMNGWNILFCQLLYWHMVVSPISRASCGLPCLTQSTVILFVLPVPKACVIAPSGGDMLHATPSSQLRHSSVHQLSELFQEQRLPKRYLHGPV